MARSNMPLSTKDIEDHVRTIEETCRIRDDLIAEMLEIFINTFEYKLKRRRKK